MAEEQEPKFCDRCDRETDHLIQLTAPDNSVRYVCWSCFSRTEKRFITKETWRRSRRSSSAQTRN